MLSSYAANTLLAVGAYLLFKLVKSYWAYFFSPLWKLPGPRNFTFLFGNVLNSESKPLYHDHQKWVDEAGHTADMVHYTGFLGEHTILIVNADYVKTIVMAPASKSAHLKYVRHFAAFMKMVGNGLITLNGEQWHRHRRLFHPAFAANFLREQMNHVVPSKTQQLMECWKASQGRELDIASHFSMLTLDVIGQVGFSHDFEGMKSVEEWAKRTGDGETNNKLPELQDKILESMKKAFGLTIPRLLVYGLGISALDFEGRKVSAVLNEAVDEVIRNARAQLKMTSNNNGSINNGNSKSKYATKSVLQLMLEAQNKQDGATLTDAELRDEVKTFIVAGHETTR